MDLWSSSCVVWNRFFASWMCGYYPCDLTNFAVWVIHAWLLLMLADQNGVKLVTGNVGITRRCTVVVAIPCGAGGVKTQIDREKDSYWHVWYCDLDWGTEIE